MSSTYELLIRIGIRNDSNNCKHCSSLDIHIKICSGWDMRNERRCLKAGYDLILFSLIYRVSSKRVINLCFLKLKTPFIFYFWNEDESPRSYQNFLYLSTTKTLSSWEQTYYSQVVLFILGSSLDCTCYSFSMNDGF